MKVTAAVLRRLAAWAPLVALVPAERMFAALAVAVPSAPYLVLRLAEVVPLLRTSSHTRVERQSLEIHVYAAQLDLAEAIAAQIAGRLGRAAFDFDGGRVLDAGCRLAGVDPLEHGNWQLTLRCELVCQHHSK
jgi:hypothetical protein